MRPRVLSFPTFFLKIPSAIPITVLNIMLVPTPVATEGCFLEKISIKLTSLLLYYLGTHAGRLHVGS